MPYLVHAWYLYLPVLRSREVLKSVLPLDRASEILGLDIRSLVARHHLGIGPDERSTNGKVGDHEALCADISVVSDGPMHCH